MDPHPEISALSIFFTIFLVLLNGFFVAAEFAIVKVRGSQIEIKAKTGSKVAQIAKHMTTHLDGYLAATQLGITLASLGLGWVGEKVMSSVVANIFSFINLPISASLTETLGLIFAFTIITVLHIVFGELAPKTLAIQKPVATTMAIALPLQFVYIVFKPFIYVLNGFANIILKLIGIATMISGLIIAAFAGNFVGYWFGYHTGPMLYKRKESVFFKQKYLKAAEAYYNKRGAFALIMGRFVPIVRTFAPIFAGVVKLDTKKFALYNLTGAVLWICSLTLSGYFLGKEFEKQIEEYLAYIIIGFILITTIPLIIAFLKRNITTTNENNHSELDDR